MSTITLLEYEAAFRHATQSAGLSSLNLTPHTARHGGASHDSRDQLRSFADIQARGQWQSLKSVARYKKTGVYERQLSKLTEAQLDAAAFLEKSLPSRLMLPPDALDQAHWLWDMGGRCLMHVTDLYLAFMADVCQLELPATTDFDV